MWGDVSGSGGRSPPTLDLSQQKKWEENQGGIEGYTYLDYRFWNFPVTEIYLWCGEWVLRSNPSGKGRPLVDVPLTNVLGLVADAQGLTNTTSRPQRGGRFETEQAEGLRRGAICRLQ